MAIANPPQGGVLLRSEYRSAGDWRGLARGPAPAELAPCPRGRLRSGLPAIPEMSLAWGRAGRAGRAMTSPNTTPQAASPEGAAWVFNAPPGWPPAPPGWQPAPGWQPDASWPPAPAGWEFWLPAPPAGPQAGPPSGPQSGPEAAPAAGGQPMGAVGE